MHSWDGKEEIFWDTPNPDCNVPSTYYCWQDTTSSRMVCNDDYAGSKATCVTTSIGWEWSHAETQLTQYAPVGPVYGRTPMMPNCVASTNDPFCVPFTASLSASYRPLLVCSGAVECTANPTPMFYPIPAPWAPVHTEDDLGHPMTLNTWYTTGLVPGPYSNEAWSWHPAPAADDMFATRNGSNGTNHTALPYDAAVPKLTASVSNTLTAIDQPTQATTDSLTTVNQPAQTSHALVTSDLEHPARSVNLEKRVNKPVSYSEAVCKGAEVLAMVKTGTTASTFTNYNAFQSGGYLPRALDPLDGALDAVLSKQGINVPKQNLQPWKMIVRQFALIHQPRLLTNLRSSLIQRTALARSNTISTLVLRTESLS